MSAPAFTAGTWQVRALTFKTRPPRYSVSTLAGNDGKRIVGIASHIHAAGDANLIAAAPDIYAALQSIMREYRHVMGDDTPEIRDAFAALAKARGEEAPENDLPKCPACGAPAGSDCRTIQGRIPPQAERLTKES